MMRKVHLLAIVLLGACILAVSSPCFPGDSTSQKEDVSKDEKAQGSQTHLLYRAPKGVSAPEIAVLAMTGKETRTAIGKMKDSKTIEFHIPLSYSIIYLGHAPTYFERDKIRYRCFYDWFSGGGMWLRAHPTDEPVVAGIVRVIKDDDAKLNIDGNRVELEWSECARAATFSVKLSNVNGGIRMPVCEFTRKTAGLVIARDELTELLLFRSRNELEGLLPNRTFRSLEEGTRILYTLHASIVGRDAEGCVVYSASSKEVEYLIEDPDPEFLKDLEKLPIQRRTMSREEYEQLP